MKVKLENVVLAFPHLFEFDRFDRFSANAIFPKDHPAAKQAQAAMQQVATEKWGKKAPEVFKQLKAQGKLCLQDGDAKSQHAGFEGNLFVAASSKDMRPVVKDQDGRTNVEQIDGKIYPGLVVNMIIDIWAQDNPKWGKRINAALLGVQKVRDGDRLAGGEGLAEDDFEAIPGADLDEGDFGDTSEEAPDPFGEDDDDDKAGF